MKVGGRDMANASQAARIAVCLYSLSISGILIFLLILAQPLGLPFDYGKQENLRLMDIVLPTFLGYLGAASHFVFNGNRGRDVDDRNAGMMMILIHGPFAIFGLGLCALFFTYYTSH